MFPRSATLALLAAARRRELGPRRGEVSYYLNICASISTTTQHTTLHIPILHQAYNRVLLVLVDMRAGNMRSDAGRKTIDNLPSLTNLQAYFDLNNTVLSCILIINTALITLNALAGATPSSFIPLYVGNYTRCSRAPSHVTPNSISCNRSTGSVSCSLKVATAGSL